MPSSLVGLLQILKSFSYAILSKPSQQQQKPEMKTQQLTNRLFSNDSQKICFDTFVNSKLM